MQAVVWVAVAAGLIGAAFLYSPESPLPATELRCWVRLDKAGRIVEYHNGDCTGLPPKIRVELRLNEAPLTDEQNAAYTRKEPP